MSAPELEIETILDELVHQFSDPLAFFRELVQNSIDAGSGEIEVELDFEEAEEGGGRAIVAVRDWGKGMTRTVIEDELLRLFSSGKDQDLTQVGQFGIGFVSVFAVEPESVVVDTGRHGEWWRIVFGEDRTYELFELDRPIEGTRVVIRISMDRDEYEILRRDTRRALVRWCKHADIPVRLEGEDIRRPFAIDSPVTTTHSEEGTRVVMGFVDEDEAHSGYYNRGLTLKEEAESPWPWVSFKIDSRYLDHTLTRDQLLVDRHLSKATKLLEELAEETAPAQLITRMEQLATGGEQADEYAACCRYLTHYLRYDKTFRRSWREREIFRSVCGEPMSWMDVDRCLNDGRLHLTKMPEIPKGLFGGDHRFLVDDGGLRPLFEHLVDESHTDFFKSFLGGSSRRDLPGYVEDTFLIPEALASRSILGLLGVDRLEEALTDLLDAARRTNVELIVASSTALPSVLGDDVAVAMSADRRAVRVDEVYRPGFDDGVIPENEEVILVINADHRLTRQFDVMAEREPESAALMFLESLFVDGNADFATPAAIERLVRIEGVES